jgi:SAM-dependent methyltransferase
MRRRRGARQAREAWLSGPSAFLARAIDSQAGMAALTPRAGKIVDLLELRPGKRYVDIGCGTAAFAHVLAQRAGMDEPPYCMDLTGGPGPVDFIGWPERIPLRDASVDAVSCLYYLRRFDDDVTHGFGGELARILAPGGRAIIVEIAPVRNGALNNLHSRLVSGGTAEVDLRGWGRMAALLTECGFNLIERLDLGPFLLPPVPRVAILVARD